MKMVRTLRKFRFLFLLLRPLLIVLLVLIVMVPFEINAYGSLSNGFRGNAARANVTSRNPQSVPVPVPIPENEGVEEGPSPIPTAEYSREEIRLWEEVMRSEPVETLSRNEMNSLILMSQSRPLGTKRQQPPFLYPAPPSFTDSPVTYSMFTFPSRAETCPNPPNFPPSIPLISKEFRNWAENIHIANMWTAIPRTYKDILLLANWAYLNDFMLRPKGYTNSWAPLSVTKSSSCTNTVLVDTTQFLVQMKMLSSKGSFRAVQVQTGASVESLLSFLEDHRCSLFAAPVIGEITVGGVLAVSGHGSGFGGGGGTSINSDNFRNENLVGGRTMPPAGYSSGSLSNLILSFKAVVWDPEKESYVIKKFSRTERDTRAFLTHMGRAFLTQVTLLVGPAYKMRCTTWSHLSARKLLQSTPDRLGDDEEDIEEMDDVNYHTIGSPSESSTESTETFASLVDKYHSVDLSVFPYTDQTLVMVCSNVTRQTPAKLIMAPYPFSYLDNVPRSVSTMVSQFVSGQHYLAPMMSRLNHQFNSAGLRLSTNEDIYGQSKNILLRYNSKRAFVHSYSSGYAIITSRSSLQKIISEVHTQYKTLVDRYSASWQYPQNEPLQFTVTGLDDPKHLPPFGKFDPPALSILAPIKKKRKVWDMALFIGINVYPGTRNFDKFMREFESFLFVTYDGEGSGLVRPEWSKAWGFTDEGAWNNQLLLRKVIPRTFGNDWDWTVRTLNHYDPFHVFSNDFINFIMQTTNRTAAPQNFDNNPFSTQNAVNLFSNFMGMNWQG